MSDKVTVQISKESYDFLIALAKEIASQNNRATAEPYFFVIQTEKWRVAHDECHGSDTKQVWVDRVSGDYGEWASPEEYIADCVKHHGMTQEQAEKAAEEDLEEFTFEKYIEEDNAFLTHAAFKQHVELNGHNLGRHGTYYDYLKHAFRNPEMASLFKAIKEFGGINDCDTKKS